jgi:hypothetical protein
MQEGFRLTATAGAPPSMWLIFRCKQRKNTKNRLFYPS